MADEPLTELTVLQAAIAHEMLAVAEVFQPALEDYITNAVHGSWDYLTGSTDVIDLGEVSYYDTIDRTFSELRQRVREARDGGDEASEAISLLSQMPEDEFEQVMGAVRQTYELAFVVLEPVAGSATHAQIIEPTAADEEFRREFQSARSATGLAVLFSAVVVLLCIGLLALLGRRDGKSVRLIGKTFLWYAVPTAVLLGAGRLLYSRAFFGLVEQAAAERGGLAGEQTVNTAQAISDAYGDIILRFFVPLTIFVGFCLAAGIALMVIGRRRSH